MATFFSYSSSDAEFVHLVRVFAQPSLDEIFAFQQSQDGSNDIWEQITRKLATSENFVIFAGAQCGKYQKFEVARIFDLINKPGSTQKAIVVMMEPKESALLLLGGEMAPATDFPRIDALQKGLKDEEAAEQVAKAIAYKWGLRWKPFDGLAQDPHLFSYEKDIIKFFHNVKRLFPDGRIDSPIENLKPDLSEADKAIVIDIREKWLRGCPMEWKDVRDFAADASSTTLNELPQEEIGAFRPRDARVLAKGLTTYASAESGVKEFTLQEAGPRKELYYPRNANTLKVGIIVSGGIAPGINAVIDGIVQRHFRYAKHHGYLNGLKIEGFRDGFLSLSKHPRPQSVVLAPDVTEAGQAGCQGAVCTAAHAHEGGSILGTSRADALLASNNRASNLLRIDEKLADLDILYVIGGDGTMKAAHALYEISARNENRDHPLSVVAIPKTMDNDVLWVWQSFGFLSAVEKAREVIDQLNTEVQSNPRLCVVQLFGSDSGFVVSHTVLAEPTGHCLVALIPEVPFSMTGKKGLIADLRRRLSLDDGRLPHGIVVMAETAIPTDADLYLTDDKNSEFFVHLTDEEKSAINEFTGLRKNHRRIQGQTRDELRSAGLKIVSQGLEKALKKDSSGRPMREWENFRVFCNEPRHLLRAIPPSCLDIIFGQRLGTLAVDDALAGFTDFMISQWLTEYVLVPLELASLGRKRIPQEGIFWKSVLAKTRQTAVLDSFAAVKPKGE
jgi:6-phosphofructokinase 1